MTVTYERILKRTYANYNLRLWIADTGQGDNYFNDIVIKCVELLATYATMQLRDLAHMVLAYIDVINAVELTHYGNDGVVLYRDWP